MNTIAKDNRIHEPIIDTERLILRPLTQADAAVVQFLAGDKAIAATTLSIPHPYGIAVAEKWIKSIKGDIAEGKSVVFAITENNNGNLLGTAGLMINKEHDHAEMGYWIGKDYWGKGYCTEAARAVLEYGFKSLGLNRIFAHHFKGNDASGRIMRKIGMSYEGSKKGHIKKWGQYKDIENYGLVREDYRRGDQNYRLTGMPFAERYSFI